MQIKNDKKLEKIKKLDKNKGITLISLVITIVVLIIISGVTMDMTIGENGIFTRAKYARDQYLNIETAEQEKINNLYKELSGNVDESEETLDSVTWIAKKSTEEKSSDVQIYVYSSYYCDVITLNEYKEQYIVKTLNEIYQQGGYDISCNSLDELILYNVR